MFIEAGGCFRCLQAAGGADYLAAGAQRSALDRSCQAAAGRDATALTPVATHVQATSSPIRVFWLMNVKNWSAAAGVKFFFLVI